MVWQKPSYFTQLARSYPILRFVDIYDRQSFIRAYVLDNIFVCIFVYVLLYVALWYANKAIRKIEKSNEELSAVVKENQMQLDDLVVLKRKKAEYEDVVIKVKGAQKVTAEQLEIEMKKLSAELLATANKMNELEKIVEKMVFSASAQREAAIYRVMSELGNMKMEKRPRKAVNHMKNSKFSSHPSHHLCHRNHHQENMESSLVGPLVNREQPLRLRCKTKSDSNSTTSADVSSPPISYRQPLFYADRDASTVPDDPQDDTQERNRCPLRRRRRRRCWRRRRHCGWYPNERSYEARRSSLCTMYGIPPVSLTSLTPFTRSLLEIGRRFSRQGQRASNVPLACKGILGVLTFDDRVHPQGFSSFLFLFFFFFFFFLFSFTQNGIKMVMDTSTVRLVIFLGMFLVFAGDYSIFIPSIFGKDVEKNLTDPSKGPVGPPREGSSEKLAIASSKKKEIERDSAIARRAKMMTTIKTACLPKLICELTSSVRQDQLSEMERSLLNLIRDTSLSTIAEVPSRYHFAAHMGQLISGMEGQGCHNFYPTCPLPGASVLNMMKKVRLR
ncbi:hypothetical protein KPH14_004661 [Odynerus spinipes]|uniref:Uncharacterized protein n=1 Tax=Odynerus spinipes TaxID=1348599 RepID=A0AAD9RM72_9HYME|nr:hypothetical protein KPH14_004661 [Odynerus spinipes]